MVPVGQCSCCHVALLDAGELALCSFVFGVSCVARSPINHKRLSQSAVQGEDPPPIPDTIQTFVEQNSLAKTSLKMSQTIDVS